ncbi:hypothetical protein LINGRAHAP2_LOCUS31264 [Linum grandiflorum]
MTIIISRVSLSASPSESRTRSSLSTDHWSVLMSHTLPFLRGIDATSSC